VSSDAAPCSFGMEMKNSPFLDSDLSRSVPNLAKGESLGVVGWTVLPLSESYALRSSGVP
jgi:hypothetical protein